MHTYRIRPMLAVSILALIVAPAFAANDGTIEITGRIVATTCTVEGKPPGEGAVSKPVALGDISSGALAKPGQTAGDRGFVIQIGGNDECTDGVLAKVRFDPASPALDHTTGRLNIDGGAGAASNVQIQVADGDGTPINMYTQDSKSEVISGHTASIPLIARYYSLGAVTQGAANSRVGFQVVYE